MTSTVVLPTSTAPRRQIRATENFIAQAKLINRDRGLARDRSGRLCPKVIKAAPTSPPANMFNVQVVCMVGSATKMTSICRNRLMGTGGEANGFTQRRKLLRRGTPPPSIR